MVNHKDADKLRFLLPHWIEHGNEHAEEFRTWANKATLSKQDILAAAGHYEVAARSLEAALEKLGGPIEKSQL